MPAQQGTKLKGLFGGTFDKHKGDETVAPKGGGDLPAGINAGVAQLVENRVGKYENGDNKGKPFVYMAGVVVETEPEYKGCIGQRTSKLFPLCDTKNKTKDQNVAAYLNELRLLGLETKHLSEEDIDDAIAELVKQGPFFKFQTWKSEPTKEYPNPRTNHKWMGAMDFTPSEGGSVEDNSGGDDGTGTEDAGSGSGEGEGVTDWVEVGEQADGGDDDAREKLVAAAREAGYTDKQIEAVADWKTLGTELNEKSGSSAGDEGEAADWAPKVDDVYPYKPKGKRAAVDCVVTAVFSKTVNLKEEKTGTIHKSVPWTSNPDTLGGAPV